ncbi:Uncharacterised protein [Neisseria animaloris]|uniref:Uncharacterized protein n=1 Tax=Neisseria animaloris TaxID=326522 RepID=A0A448U963_9NEIS|nr:Uncharacterised protein [Neisseria animaloris]
MIFTGRPNSNRIGFISTEPFSSRRFIWIQSIQSSSYPVYCLFIRQNKKTV